MIKKHRNKNDYYLAGTSSLWIRNFCKKNVLPVDINNLISDSDMQLMLQNEMDNHCASLQHIDTEIFVHRKIAIISDGHLFEQSQELLEKIPSDVTVIGVNEAMRLWTNKQKMHYYVVNDPYETCLRFLPKEQRLWPKYIASCRTNPEFLSKLNGLIYDYSPVMNTHYSGLPSEAEYHIDDYRNAVCAAIGLAYKFGVQKLMLFWCCDVFDHPRAGAEKLDNETWIYPQQLTAHQLVDGNLFWLKSQGIKIGHHSKGPEYKNAAFVKENEISQFFN